MTKLITMAASTLTTTFALAGAASAESALTLGRADSAASSLCSANVRADQAGRVGVALDRLSSSRDLVIMTDGDHPIARLDVREAPTD